MNWQVNKPIVVPFDFSDHAKAAVRQALEMADSPEQVHVVHVLALITPTEPGVGWGMIDDGQRMAQTMEAMLLELPDPEFEGVDMTVRLGDAGTEVAQYVDELDAGLVVVGSHGRTGLTRIVLGSVAERVARMAKCPVLIVKLPTAKEKAAEPPSNESHTETDGVFVI